MKTASTFERNQLVRVEKRRLARAAHKKALRRISGAWKPGKRDSNDPLLDTKAREKSRLDSDPSVIRRSKFKRPGVPRKGV